MPKLSFSVICVFLFLLNPHGLFAQGAPAPNPTTICVEDRFWPPGSFFLDGQAFGTHVDIARSAAQKASIPISFNRMPWKRCLSALESGAIDAVLSASYRDTGTFLYPPGATSDAPHPQSLEMIEFTLVTRVDEPVADMMVAGALLPQPIGVPLGYISVEDYIQKGIQVTQLMNNTDLFDLLQRGRVKSLILASPLYDFYSNQPAYIGLFKKTPLLGRTGPLYLIFSKDSKLPSEKIRAFWQAIEAVRLDKKLMKSITEKAYSQSNQCLQTPARCQ